MFQRGEILSDNMRGLMLPYGEGWRKWRKVRPRPPDSRRASIPIPVSVTGSPLRLTCKTSGRLQRDAVAGMRSVAA